MKTGNGDRKKAVDSHKTETWPTLTDAKALHVFISSFCITCTPEKKPVRRKNVSS